MDFSREEIVRRIRIRYATTMAWTEEHAKDGLFGENALARGIAWAAGRLKPTSAPAPDNEQDHMAYFIGNIKYENHDEHHPSR